MTELGEATTSSGYPHRHLLGIEGLTPGEITFLLDLADSYVDLNSQGRKRKEDPRRQLLAGCTLINLFFENSTRTLTSFELAGKLLGAEVINMVVGSSSVKKGETLIDTATTLNAMHPDLLVVRHDSRARSSCCRRRSTAVSSTAATAVTSTPRKRFWMRSPSAGAPAGWKAW